MFCMYCGNKVEPSYNVCPNCRAILGNNRDVVNATTIPEHKKGKDIGSVILGLFGLYYVIVTFTHYKEIIEENIELFEQSKVGAAVGMVLLPLIFGIIALILALSSRTSQKNYSNLAALLMCGLIAVGSIVLFILTLMY